MANNTTDVMVIGAGVVGLACAFRLAREGQRVMLIDRDEPGLGASFGNAGHIATEQVFPLASPQVLRGALHYLFDSESPLHIQPAYLTKILPWLLRFAWSARKSAFERGVTALASLQKSAAADFTSLLHEVGAAQLLKMNGHLVLVEKLASVQAAQQEIVRLRAFGIDANWISREHVAHIAPEITAHVEGALKFTGTGHVEDPYAVCTALRDAFLAAGGTFVRTNIEGVGNTSAGFRAVDASGEHYVARHLVLACGAWSKSIAAQLGYVVPLDTERGYHITLPGFVPRFSVPIASFERKVIMTPMSCGLRMTGTVEFGGLDLPPDPKRFALLKRHMKALAGDIPVTNATNWMGFRPSLSDHLPVLGRVPDGRHLYFAFGHQHLGLTLAGVTARIIAAQVLGRGAGIDMAPFAADRF